MPFKPGDFVILRARVVNVYGTDREEAYQTFGLQLADGQGVQTNVKNLSPDPEDSPAKEPELPFAAPPESEPLTLDDEEADAPEEATPTRGRRKRGS